MTKLAQRRLQEALEAEHAAVYGYDIVGVHLTGAQQERAKADAKAHRELRNTLTVKLSARHRTPRPAAPAYALPYRVSHPADALRLALTLEERAAGVWELCLGDLHGADRRLALDALTNCALRALRWRQTIGTEPVTEAFPGR